MIIDEEPASGAISALPAPSFALCGLLFHRVNGGKYCNRSEGRYIELTPSSGSWLAYVTIRGLTFSSDWKIMAATPKQALVSLIGTLAQLPGPIDELVALVRQSEGPPPNAEGDGWVCEVAP